MVIYHRYTNADNDTLMGVDSNKYIPPAQNIYINIYIYIYIYENVR